LNEVLLKQNNLSGDISSGHAAGTGLIAIVLTWISSRLFYVLKQAIDSDK
jgi:hypothetical protein